tara:strand:- start:440 stop:1075 length:636 start_codon:yes stop_codon:yes gene_type:complete
MEGNGIYVGRVIYDSDLADTSNKRPLNRVKVLIEGKTDMDPNYVSYKHPRGINAGGSISSRTLELIDKEVYAYVLQPVMATGSNVRYNASSDQISVSDSNYPDDIDSRPPAVNYGVWNGYDGFNQAKIGTAGVNTTSSAYTPDNRSNAGKGLFALPTVGCTVLVGFINSKRGLPIVLGIIPGYDSINTVHGTGVDGIYPNLPLAYSNIKQQ